MTLARGVQDPASRGAHAGFMHRTSLGALANSGANALRLICQLGLLPILARLIGPAEYGIVALAMPVILLANMLSDGGLVSALARLPDADRTVESSAFWITVGVGLSLALATCAAAFPIGWALDQPKLPWLIIALSPILLMNSITAVSNGRIIRERRFGAFAAGDALSNITGAAVALLAATHGWGAWSLVAQQLALWVCKLVWITSRGRAQVGFVFRFGEVRELVKFGANNLGSTISDFVSKNVDNIIIGGVLGATSLGYYAMAYQVIRVPDLLISGPFWFYIFTALSRATHRGERSTIQELAQASLRLSSTALAPLFCGLALVADLAAPVFLGPKWTGAIGPLRLLAAAGFGFCMCSIMAAMLMGMNKAPLQFRLAVLLGMITVVTVGGAVRFGLEPVSAALACGVSAVGLVYIDQLARDLRTPRASLLRAFLPALFGCIALSAAVLLIRRLLHGAGPGAVLAAAVPAGAAAYAAVVWLVARGPIMADARAFSRAHADVGGPEPDDAAAAKLEAKARSVRSGEAA
jgi:PST family polysaccharide transporter